jgi:ATP-dependent DNA helicase PIF1
VWSDAASSTATPKAILTLTLDDAAVINRQIIGALPGNTIVATACDNYLDCKEPDLYPEEFVQSLQISGIPHGQLHLKVGARYIIIRNMDRNNGVVNGAQILCTAVTSRIITGNHHCPSIPPKE